MSTGSEADRKQILQHIDSIFDSFIKKDRKAIRDAHSADWVGFMGPSTQIERGIEAYMKNADLSLDNFNGTGYEIIDSEVQLYGDLAIVFYVARYDYLDSDNQAHSIPLRSVDIYRRENDDWIQTGSHITVVPSEGAWGEGDQ